MGRGIGVNGLSLVLAAYVADRIAAVIMVDNLIFRFLAVSAGSVINTVIRLFFYGLLYSLNSQPWPAAER